MAQKSDDFRRLNNECLACTYFLEITNTQRRGKVCMSTDCKLKGITNVKTNGCDSFKLVVKNEKYNVSDICRDLLQWCDPKGISI
jgi:hypothetical protein